MKRIEEIDAEVWTDDDLSDDEIEARYAKYDDEITSLNAQIETLERKRVGMRDTMESERR